MKKLFLIFLFLSFSHFMFYSSVLRPRRVGFFPIVNYRVNADTGYTGYTQNEFLEKIKESADTWFSSANAKVSFYYRGEIDTKRPKSPTNMNCSEDSLKELQSTEDTIYVGENNDPDCTSHACSFIWICGDEIQRADTQLNPDLAVELDAKLENLQKLLLHEFGHTLGLNHCLKGDTDAACLNRQNTAIPTSNPQENSVMYTHFFSGNVVPVVDDIEGVRKLYGEVVNHFPKSGDYVLKPYEIEGMSILENEEVLYAFLLPSEADIRKNFMESLTYIPASQEEIDKEMEAKAKGEAYERKKLSLSEAMSQESIDMNLYFVDIESRIPSLTDKELETLRMNSVSAINSYYRLKAIMETEANFDALYYENILNRHVTIRKEASDELIRRGL